MDGGGDEEDLGGWMGALEGNGGSLSAGDTRALAREVQKRNSHCGFGYLELITEIGDQDCKYSANYEFLRAEEYVDGDGDRIMQWYWSG